MRALFLLIDPNQPGLSEAERLAIGVRNSATMLGVCACGGTATLNGDGTRTQLHHETDCPAISPILEQLVDRMGTRLQFAPVIVDLEEVA